MELKVLVFILERALLLSNCSLEKLYSVTFSVDYKGAQLLINSRYYHLLKNFTKLILEKCSSRIIICSCLGTR